MLPRAESGRRYGKAKLSAGGRSGRGAVGRQQYIVFYLYSHRGPCHYQIRRQAAIRALRSISHRNVGSSEVASSMRRMDQTAPQESAFADRIVM